MDYFVLRFDHSYRKEDFRALSISARAMRLMPTHSVRQRANGAAASFPYSASRLDCLRSFPAS